MPKLLQRVRASIARRLVPRRLAAWRSGGILLTYRCNAACADCYENSGPRKRSVLAVADLRRLLRELRQLGFSGSDLHFGGGEPFFDYEHLTACFEAARAEGMLPLGKLETNGFWCKSERLGRERLSAIQRYGVRELVISSDAFHQEFVPIASVQRAVRLAREILGDDVVRVSNPDFFRDPVDVMQLSEGDKTALFREVLHQHPWRMMGRATTALAHLGERRPVESFAGDRCARKLLRKGTFHIDPHGNVFPSTCAGISLGNATHRPLAEIHASYDPSEHPLVSALAAEGPGGLLPEARAHGFAADPAGYASKCHLCFEVRRFFAEKGLHAEEVAPGELYSDQG